MKRILSFGTVASLALLLTPAVHAQTRQLLQGTQLRLVLLNALSTSVSRNGDPFVAEVAEPVYLGNQLILPAGARVRGVVTDVERPKRFALIRGGASMSLLFKSIEVQSRILPARMSLLGIYKSTAEGGKRRTDLKEIEGVAVEQKRDIKGDIVDASIGTGGGSLIGLVFSHVVRGFGIGLAGSAAYVAVKRGKNLQLPAQTVMLVRLDNSVWVPSTTGAGYSTGMD